MNNFIPLGRVGAPFGILGWNHFLVYADDPKAWLMMPIWYLGNEQKGFRPIEHKKLMFKNNKCLVQLENNASRDVAFSFEGLLLGAPLNDLPALSDNEFYWEELKQMAVILPTGEEWATVLHLMESPAHAVLVVKDKKQQEHLLPFVPQVVLNINKNKRQIFVDWEKDW